MMESFGRIGSQDRPYGSIFRRGSLFGLSGVPVFGGSFYDRTPNGGHWSHNAAAVSDSMIPEMNAVLNLRFRAAPRAREKFGFAHFLFLIARLVHSVPTLALAPKHFTSWAKIAHVRHQ